MAVPDPCPAGYYCPEGTPLATKYPCPAGTYGPDLYYESIDNCTSCDPGFYCGTDGLDNPTDMCDAGYYCTGGADSPTPIDHLVGVTCKILCLN